MTRVTIWNEFIHEKEQKECAAIYPNGIHSCIAKFLSIAGCDVKTAVLDDVEHGLNDNVLENTDVLIWWGHAAHHRVSDEVARKVHQRVLRGMGAIFLHSAHLSKPFISLMGTSCYLSWRDDDYERLWTVAPSHPIAQGIDEYIEFPEEMYGERFDIPAPDELVFIGWFAGGEVFRSGCCWNRGLGKVFYFQPGHETNPTYHIPQIQKIITNAVHWASPHNIVNKLTGPNVIESPESKRRNNINFPPI